MFPSTGLLPRRSALPAQGYAYVAMGRGGLTRDPPRRHAQLKFPPTWPFGPRVRTMPLSQAGKQVMRFLMTSQYKVSFGAFFCDDIDSVALLMHDLDELGIVSEYDFSWVISFWYERYGWYAERGRRPPPSILGLRSWGYIV